jgi:glycosyltransferase involved in cell wall biosynthesis
VTRPRLAGRSIAVDGRYARRPGMGIHRYLGQVVRLLTEAGADVTLLTNFDPSEFEACYRGVSWCAFGSATNIVWEQLSLPRHLRRAGYDLYWAPANMGIPFLPTGRTLRVFTLHDLVPLIFARKYLLPRPLLAGPYLVWTVAAVTRSQVIFTDSRSSQSDLRRIFRRSSVVAPPLLYADQLPDAPPGLDVAGHVDVDHPYVLYNGGLDRRKNVPVLLEAFRLAGRRRPDLRLVLMGRGYDGLVPELERLGIADRVMRTGYVTDETRDALLGSASALLYTSTYEGFGFPIVEAFAAGVPVVTSPNSSLLEVAGDAALFAAPDRPGEIARAMVEVLDGDVAARLRDAGRRRLDRFDFEGIRSLIVDELVALLERGVCVGS